MAVLGQMRAVPRKARQRAREGSMTLWTPAGHTPRRQDAPKPQAIRLNDGQILRFIERVTMRDPATGTVCHALYFNGPKQLKVIASIDPTPHGALLHVSLSYPNRDPSWDVIKAIRAAFYGDDIDVMIVLPKAEDYVNRHDHCFHLWETPKKWGIR